MDKPDCAKTVTLADLYDADLRTRDEIVRTLAKRTPIPHPLEEVQYADGIKACTHARKHERLGRLW